MPTKRNKAGNQQNYVPKGNGDASGEYGDNATGSNKHFTTFAKGGGENKVDNAEKKFEKSAKEKLQSEIDLYAGLKELGERRAYIRGRIMEEWENKNITDDEWTDLMYDYETKLDEEKQNKQKEEQEDLNNFYKGDGENHLKTVLSSQLANSKGKLTPNGKKLLDQIQGADDELSGVIGTFYENNRNVDIKIGKNLKSQFSRSGWFGQIYSRSVYLGGESIGEGEKYSNYSKGGVFFHESGHALDYTYQNNHSLSWSSNYLSTKYKKTLSDMIKDEISLDVDFEEVKKDYENMVNGYKTEEYDNWEKERDALKQETESISKGVYNNEETKKIESELNKLREQKVSCWRKGDYEGMKEYQQKIYNKQDEYENYSKSLYPPNYSQKIEKIRTLENNIYNARKQAREKANIKYGDFSDMMQGSINKKLGMGHGDTYFFNDKDNRGTEAFAEIMSAKATNPESLEVMKKYIPKTLEIFDEIITTIKKGTRR